MIGFSETFSLVHALAGLSVGFLWGMRYSVLPGIGVCLGGSVVGLIAGFLVSHVPREVNFATAKISRRHQLLATVFALSGYLAWLAIGVAFWWACVSLVMR